MKKFSTLSMASIALVTLPFLTSCQDEDFGYTTQDVRNSVYARNFENHYGKVASDQTWDFSSFNLNRLGLEGGPTSSSVTRAAATYTGQVTATSATGINTTTDTYYTVDPNTITWLNTYLKEGVNNRRLGNPFSLVVSKDQDNNNLDFVIIPIYQGQAGMQWDLHLVAEDPNDHQIKDYTLWQQSENIQYQNNYNDWVEFFYNSDSDDDYDTSKKSSESSTLKLRNAFPGISSVEGDVKIRFVIPVGKKIEGKFVLNGSQDNLPEDLKPSSNYSWNNESGATDMTVDIDLSSLDKSKFADLQFQFWNATTRYENDGWQPNFVNCYEEVRMHVYTTYNYTTDWTTPPTGSFTSGHTVNRTAVQSKGIKIDSKKINEDFFLYLKVTKGQGNYADDNACQRSDEGMMLALTNCTAPSNLVNDIKTLTGIDMVEGEYFIIGCEDANQNGSDNDINDVCFLIAGLPKAPKIKETIKKRYMIEDLGSTFDWDFNDIVVDVTQTRVKSVSGIVDNAQTQTFATLYHLCGTIPFKVQVGETVLGNQYNDGIYPGNNADCGEGGNGYKPQDNDVYYTNNRLKNVPITGWIPENNNIIVTTWPNLAGWNSYTDQENGLENTPLNDGEQFHFPASGTKFPYIIACDQDIEPQKEGINVPASWFWTKPVIEDNDNPGGNDTPQQQDKTKKISLGETVNYSFPDNDDWSVYCYVSGEEFTDVNVGDQIIVDINGRWEWAQAYLKSMEGSWSNLANNDHLQQGNNTLTYTINDEITLNNIKNNGIAIQGKGFDLKKVYIEPAEQPLANLSHIAEGSVTLKNDPQTFDNWNGGIQIDKSNFKLGDVIIVHISQAYASSQLGLRQNDGGWKALNNNYLEYINNITGDYEINVDQTLLDAISSNSNVLIIQGKNLTVSKVTLRPAPVDPVAVIGISLNVSSQDVAQGKTFQLAVTFNPANATNKDITWESNNTKVSVSNDGLVSVAADATVGDIATITATSEDGGFKATCEITVIEAPASEVIWEGNISGQFQALAYGGQNNKQNGASKTLIECLDSGLTKLKFTFDKTSNVWYEILGAKENGTGGWHKLFGGNTNGSTLEVDLSSYVATIKTEDGIVLQGGDYGNLTKIEAYQ